jgi:hypothetical protein
MKKATKPPTIHFVYTAALRNKVVKVLDAIESDEDPKSHAEDLGNVVVELTEVGLAYFFLKPLELAKAGFVLRQTGELGMAGTQRMMSPVIRSIIGRLDGEQLQAIAKFMREIMT